MLQSTILLADVSGVWQYVFGILMFVTSVFLILLVLVQRGRGGGLAGAFGGMGGQSAFGTKAGDLFTRITMGVAAAWILLCICAILVLNQDTSVFPSGESAFGAATQSESSPADEGSSPDSSVTSEGGLEPADDETQPADSTPE